MHSYNSTIIGSTRRHIEIFPISLGHKVRPCLKNDNDDDDDDGGRGGGGGGGDYNQQYDFFENEQKEVKHDN